MNEKELLKLYEAHFSNDSTKNLFDFKRFNSEAWKDEEKMSKSFR